MSDPFEYLARAKDCLLKAGDAPNQDLKQNWLDAADNWLRMVPQDLRTRAERFEEAERDQSIQEVASRTWH
jgi:hypothetical protein